MAYTAINFKQKFSKFSEQWQPKVIAQVNDYQFKLAKLEGEFVWHQHDDTDEAFIVIEGALRIEFRDGHVDLNIGEMFVVPQGIEHKPIASSEAKVMIIEPVGVLNTGDSENSALAADNDIWI